ncbi:hypothetical protein [Enterococcus casseliflavus]|uniref:hypothetical protein n=1 Tax=Enterococcus casseliflavus TaxID=37734 RepID=UPI001CA9FDFC|nr:hypothetical protein [Enterococcus casseliflavus]MBZ0323604.1 hypothetical protein [Enterococcus casseliflavus]
MSRGPVIRLSGYTINNINYETIENPEEIVSTGDPEFSFEFGFTEDYKEALVTMSVEMIDLARARSISVSVSGNFIIPESDIAVEEIQMYVAHNGSAMIYPYLRAAVSVITTLDGPSAIVLPTLNMIEELSKNAENN